MDKKAVEELLIYLLEQIDYIRTHKDEHNVTAICNLIESKIKEFKEKL